jgi:3-hydroxy-9,10-secoandrosta-1,3,5(10)-triene-9,17-dione monooxygenase reductase component
MPDTTIAGTDATELRRALGCFVTGVTIMGTRTATGAPIGLTVNSFSSVSLSPPLVLWSLARSASSFDAFAECETFGVNVLAVDQVELSDRFAKSGGDKFAGLAFSSGIGDVPLLDGAVAHFACRTVARHPGGDHVILIGEVLACSRTDRAPLLYARGAYGAVGDRIARNA